MNREQGPVDAGEEVIFDLYEDPCDLYEEATRNGNWRRWEDQHCLRQTGAQAARRIEDALSDRRATPERLEDGRNSTKTTWYNTWHKPCCPHWPEPPRPCPEPEPPSAAILHPLEPRCSRNPTIGISSSPKRTEINGYPLSVDKTPETSLDRLPRRTKIRSPSQGTQLQQALKRYRELPEDQRTKEVESIRSNENLKTLRDMIWRFHGRSGTSVASSRTSSSCSSSSPGSWSGEGRCRHRHPRPRAHDFSPDSSPCRP